MSNAATPFLSDAYLAARDAANAAADEESRALEARGGDESLDSKGMQDWLAAKKKAAEAREEFEKHVDRLPQNART